MVKDIYSSFTKITPQRENVRKWLEKTSVADVNSFVVNYTLLCSQLSGLGKTTNLGSVPILERNTSNILPLINLFYGGVPPISISSNQVVVTGDPSLLLATIEEEKRKITDKKDRTADKNRSFFVASEKDGHTFVTIGGKQVDFGERETTTAKFMQIFLPLGTSLAIKEAFIKTSRKPKKDSVSTTYMLYTLQSRLKEARKILKSHNVKNKIALKKSERGTITLEEK
jgi:hypothetical protein